ncbi:MAG TPA: hypothetical protein VK188_05090 [Holophaga sp.]|nr:hypothetical protein [Holophaga sp.]
MIIKRAAIAPLLLLSGLLVSAPGPQASRRGIRATAPAYQVLQGGTDEGGIPTSAARLLVYRGGRPVLHEPPPADPPFGADGRVQTWEAGPGPRLYLFSAVSHAGGSGGTVYLALLQDHPEGLLELMPGITFSTLSEFRFLRDPARPEAPVVAVAEAIWASGEAHFGNHRQRIKAFAQDPATGRYALRADYTTTRKYPSEGDGRVLAAEGRTLLARLRQR